MNVVNNTEYMMIDWKKIQACSYEDKKIFLEMIKELVKIGQAIRAQGIGVSLEEAEKTKDLFLRVGLNLISTGCSPVNAQKILLNLLHSTSLGPAEYLKRIIQIQAIVLFQCNETKENIQNILTSYLGMDFICENSLSVLLDYDASSNLGLYL